MENPKTIGTFFSMLSFTIGILLFSIFILLSAIHFYWGLGGKWGTNASIPTNENNKQIMHPKLLDCFVVGTGLLSFGVFILIKIKIVSFDLPSFLLKYGLTAISILFILRATGEFKYAGFFKKIKNTHFGQMDTKYYSPLCLLIGILGIMLELIQ